MSSDPSQPMPCAPILIVDDQGDVREALRLLAKAEGYATQTADSPAAALAAAAKTVYAAALIDLNYTRDTTSGAEGLELLAKLKQLDAELPVIVMTAWATIDLAVEAMRRGAGDFVEKPWNNARLASVLRNQIALGAAARRARRLDAENALLRGSIDEPFIAESAAMQPVLALIERVAPTDANVLILGENGSGKGLIADLIHRRSRRCAASFVKVNMGGIAESVFEAEMFGHVRGAFTDAKTDRIGRFELANGGTLFLDEVANLPPAQQPKLLRVLEDGEFERVGSSRTLKSDVRLLAATNADLPAEVAAGRFRKDLLFRLNTVELRLPALRERCEDIAVLAQRFLEQNARRYARGPLRLTPSALTALQRYAWPGNVRELGHMIERAVLMANRDLIDANDLSLTSAHVRTDVASTAEPMTLDQSELGLIRNALDLSGGNILKAAEMLGLSRAALYRRLEKFGLRAAS
jgi:DNA-binding NtrC family response regulator